MEKEIFNTNELYGIFCSDESFKIYYETVVDEKIHCLFDRYIPINTIIKEEIKLFAPLIVYSPDNYSKVKNVYWLDGRIFDKDNKYYKAIRIDKLISDLSQVKSGQVDNDELKELEELINKKIKENSKKYKKMWDNITNSEKNIAKKDKKIRKIIEEKNKMINKNKIKKYVASGILGATILTGCGIAIKEAKTDHTEELCPITKILNIINPKDSSPLGIVLHQIPAMQEDYKDKGMGDVAISYESYEEEYIKIIYAKPIMGAINGEVKYIAPDGYELYEENGEYKCKKVATNIEVHHELVSNIPYAKRLKID